MWSLEALDYLNQEAARKAQRHSQEPYILSLDEFEDYPPFPFPHLGSHVPTGWERVEGQEWFVDSSGGGRPGEPALTADEFRDEIRAYVEDRPGYGFGIVEAGQFQVYVGAYRHKAA